MSSLWSKRISAQGNFFLGPGPAGHHLRYHGGLFGLRKSFSSQISLFVGHFWSFGDTLENSFFFMILSHLPAPRGTPRGVRSMVRRVFGSIWSKRISTQGRFSLGANAGGHCLGPHGGLLRLRQVVFGSYFTFWDLNWSFGGTLEKSFFHVFATFGCSQGHPRRCQIQV